MDLIKLTEEHTQLTAGNAKLSADLSAANEAKDNALKEAATYKEQAEKAALEKTEAEKALADTNAKAAAEKAALEAKINELTASQADFDKAVGFKVIEITGKGGNKAAEGQHEGDQSQSMSRADFNKLSPSAQMKFCKSGGKLTE